MKEDILKTTFPKLNEPENMQKALLFAMILNVALIGITGVILEWRVITIILFANLIALAYRYMKKSRQ